MRKGGRNHGKEYGLKFKPSGCIARLSALDRDRPHQALNYKTPDQARKEANQLAA
jgi:hypothetical protein